jgi:hypothetical protein
LTAETIHDDLSHGRVGEKWNMISNSSGSWEKEKIKGRILVEQIPHQIMFSESERSTKSLGRCERRSYISGFRENRKLVETILVLNPWTLSWAAMC